MPQVTVKLFAMIKERLGQDEVQVEVPDPITARALLDRFKEDHPAVAGLVDVCRLASDHQFCRPDDAVDPATEIALIPPVSGGSDAEPRSHVVLTRDPIRYDDYTPFIADPAAGAHALFTGVVRDNHQGRDVDSIRYEAYEEMARTQLEVVARELLAAHEDVCRVVLVHRFGHLKVGEASVLVGVSSGHREASFTVCRMGIDRIKELVPIWKKEFFPDGSAWVGDQTQ